MYIKVNPSRKIVDEVREKLRQNDGYCPCALVKNADTKCMCKDFREHIIEGECHCGLYIKYNDEKDCS